MLNAMRLGLCVALAACLLPVADALAAGTPGGNLVTTQWLQENLGDDELLLLDASPAAVYAKGHIPGAVNINMFIYGEREVADAELERLYRSWGLSAGRKVVLCDQGAGMMATRGFFSFYYYGFPEKNLFILDGGTAKWQADGLPMTTDASPAPVPGTFKVKQIREDARVRLPEFLAASGDPEGSALLEALGANWHFGEVVAFDRGGHVPHGIMLPSVDFYNADKTFKSPAEIRRMLDYLGVTPEQEIHTYCGGGIAASVPFFALRFLAGYPKVKLYVESELGWLSDDRNLPYWTYDEPNLMRRAEWLKSWGGPMLRMYGASHVSVVDVRPAEAYVAGHVPFAVNIPAGVFAEHLMRADQLASLLGPAGVDRSHEAVVVSGAGLTPDAALAYVMLEKAGQRKISILMDGPDAWEAAGFAPTKEATVVGPPASPKDQCVPATTWAGDPREGIVITDPAATQGPYPKVFVASGAAVPAVAPDGSMVHVPYTELMNADGTPKAAKDIWNTLAKAGVPRYAELVCVADAPGDAAVNYYLLKLMGYPDVKVLVR